MKEKLPKKKPQLFSLADDEDKEPEIPRLLKVCSFAEEQFEDAFSRTLDHIVDHYYEAQESFDIFSTFRPFFQKQIEKEIRVLFTKKIEMREYKRYLQSLTKFEDALSNIPDNIFFPLFEVNTEKVKTYLGNAMEDIRKKIFNKLENSIIEQYKTISDKYQDIVGHIRKVLNSPDDVEAMDKYLYDLTTEKVSLKSKAGDAFRMMMQLFKMDCICSELVLSSAKEVHEWPSNLEKELKSAEERHAIERARLENELKDKRRSFEYRVELYAQDIH